MRNHSAARRHDINKYIIVRTVIETFDAEGDTPQAAIRESYRHRNEEWTREVLDDYAAIPEADRIYFENTQRWSAISQ